MTDNQGRLVRRSEFYVFNNGRRLMDKLERVETALHDGSQDASDEMDIITAIISNRIYEFNDDERAGILAMLLSLIADKVDELRKIPHPSVN